jgi:hypothetical protein
MASDQTLLSYLLNWKPTASDSKNEPTGFSVKKYWWVFLVLTVLATVAYFNSLGNEFVSDDKGLLQVEDRLTSFGYIFSDPLSFIWSSIYALVYSVFGLNPAALRSINIFFHLGNSLLVFLILGRLFNPRVGLITSLLFSVHPLLTEAVTWISGGPYSQYGFFFLLSFLLYIWSIERPKLYYVSIGVFLIGLLDSNRVLALSPLFLAYEYAFGDIRKRWVNSLPFLTLSAIWGVIYWLQIGGRITSLAEMTYSSEGSYNPLVQIPYALYTYLKLVFWPQDLSFYQSEFVASLETTLLRWLLTLVYLFFLVWSFFRTKKVFFLLSFFLISLWLTLTPLKIALPVAERYAYLGSIGILGLLGVWGDKLANTKSLRAAFLLVFGVVILGLMVRTVYRNLDWKNTDTLMLATVKTTPTSPRANNNVGAYYYRQGDLVRAEEYWLTTIKLNPRFADAYNNLAVVALKKEAYQQAVSYSEQALKINPNFWQSWQTIGEVYLKLDQKEEAREALGKGLQINPTSPSLQNLLSQTD